MNGICGWLVQEPGIRSPEMTLDAMADALSSGRRSWRAISSSGLAAVASPAGERSVWGDPDADLICAIDGEPRWTEQDLATTARSIGNGAALAEAYHRYGEALLRRIRGSFSLVVLRPRENACFLAIDRVGIRTMCYQLTQARGFVFASTTDGLGGFPDVRSEISSQAVFDYLHFSVIPGPQTIYQNVWKLRPGEGVSTNGGAIRSKMYWQPSVVEETGQDLVSLGKELQHVLRQAVRRAVDDCGANGVGAFLSGGLDSTTILGLATELLRQPIRSFTMGFEAQEFDETSYAATAARFFNSDHRTYRVTPSDATACIHQIARVYDEPFGNSSAVPTYLCARLARDAGIKLMLAGDGGDELFAGNARYVMQMKFEMYQRLPRWARVLCDAAVMTLPGSATIPVVRKVQGYVRRARIPMPDRLETYNYLIGTPHSDVFDPDFLASIDPEGPMKTIRAVYHSCDSPSLLRRMLCFDMRVTLADNDLRKVGRTADLAGTSVRFPMLDEDVIEFAAKVPSSLLIRGFRIRHFYKEAMKNVLPREVIVKRKHGFGIPFRVWIAQPGAFRELICDTLAGLRSRGLVRSEFIDQMLTDSRTEAIQKYGQLAWYLVVLDLWMRHRGKSWA